MDNFADPVVRSAQALVETMAEVFWYIAELFCDLLSQYNAMIECLWNEMNEASIGQRELLVWELPNPPDRPPRKHRIFEEGFFTKPLNREEALAILALLFAIITELL